MVKKIYIKKLKYLLFKEKLIILQDIIIIKETVHTTMQFSILSLISLVSVAVAESCAPLYGQCGGNYFNGPTCCEPGSKCNFNSEWYSQCVYDPEYVEPATPEPNSTFVPKYPCANWYGQCGGKGWTGSNCCALGSTCVKQNDFFSQCIIKPNTGKCQGVYSQCGGVGFTGSTCCQEGTECVFSDSYYSQCRPIAGADYGVGPANNGELFTTSTSTKTSAYPTTIVTSIPASTSSSPFTYFSNSTSI